MAYWLGIDIGTTFSSAAVATEDGLVELVNLGGRAASIPSVVLPRADGELLVGDAAESRAIADPTRVAREFKRRLGDPTPLILGGTPYSAQTLTALLIRHIHDLVTRRMGGAPARVVITHPAAYSEYRRDALRGAAVEAGVQNLLLVTEPHAAAAQYASRATLTPGEVIAVYDFGGGTFDIALMKHWAGGFELIGTPMGVEALGGVDFDIAVLEHVNEMVGGAFDGLDAESEQTLAVLARLRRDSREAKESLSSDTEASISVIVPGTNRRVTVSRDDFERLIRPRIAETFVVLRRAAEAAGIQVGDINRIVLVGGSSRIPYIRERVAIETGRPIADDVDPEYAVALGAARLAVTATADPGPAPVQPEQPPHPPQPSKAQPPTTTTPTQPPPLLRTGPATFDQAEIVAVTADRADVPRLSRRAILVGSGALVAAGAVALGLKLSGSDTAGPQLLPGTDPETTTPGTSGVVIQSGGSLRIASFRPSSPIDPGALETSADVAVAAMSFEYLCGKGPGTTLQPMLAESWAASSDSSVWTFKLRAGVRWHNGEPFTAADVVDTLDRLSLSSITSYLNVGDSEAVDDLTVRVALRGSAPQFPYQLSAFNTQAVITPAGNATVIGDSALPVGTGPYKFSGFDYRSGCTFVRNDDWWGGTPTLDQVEFAFADDFATQSDSLQSGDVDVVALCPITGADALFADPSITVESIPAATHRQVWMNTREGTFADVRVRQAVALGIDRQALIDSVLNGRGDLGNDHPIAPVFDVFDAAQPQRQRDVDRAKALLDEAGKSGLAVTMHVPDLQEIPTLAELIRDQLSEIGMVVTLNVESTGTFYQERWCATYDPCDGGEEFGIVDYGPRGTPEVYLVQAYATGAWNSAHYESQQFSDVVVAYQEAVDLSGRKQAISEAQAIANEDVPYVIPYFAHSLIAYSDTVTGIVATGLGHLHLGSAGFRVTG